MKINEYKTNLNKYCKDFYLKKDKNAVTLLIKLIKEIKSSGIKFKTVEQNKFNYLKNTSKNTFIYINKLIEIKKSKSELLKIHNYGPQYLILHKKEKQIINKISKLTEHRFINGDYFKIHDNILYHIFINNAEKPGIEL